MSPVSFNFAAVFARHARERSLADRETPGERGDTMRSSTEARRSRPNGKDEQPASSDREN